MNSTCLCHDVWFDINKRKLKKHMLVHFYIDLTSSVLSYSVNKMAMSKRVYTRTTFHFHRPLRMNNKGVFLTFETDIFGNYSSLHMF